MNQTTRRFPRSLSDAFPDVRARCGDEKVMRFLHNHRITVRQDMPRLPRHRANVIPTHSGLLARLWEMVRRCLK
jgi:hypothetical protein